MFQFILCWSQTKFTIPGFPRVERPHQDHDTRRPAAICLFREGTPHCRTAPWQRKALLWWGGPKPCKEVFRTLGRGGGQIGSPQLHQIPSSNKSFFFRVKNLRQRLVGHDEEQGQLSPFRPGAAKSIFQWQKKTECNWQLPCDLLSWNTVHNIPLCWIQV